MLQQYSMSMSRFSKITVFAATIILAASCAKVATIDGTIAQAPSSQLIVKKLDVNKHQVIDTVDVDASGKFSCKVELIPGQPEFIYLYKGDRKIASLLLAEGDKVTVEADTAGNYSVAGSEESAKLAEVEKDYAAVISKLNSLNASIEGANQAQADAIGRQIVNEYIAYYRSRVKYVMENSHSLTVIPVFYQTVGDGLAVFGQHTDALHFNNVCDSLETVYPDSKYVQMLRKEAETRLSNMELMTRMGAAEEIGFPDVILPDVKGQKIKLSDVDAKVILLHFWTASEASQKMFNMDVLKPLYEKYHKKGFEIYQVALDPDKGIWANVIKEQAMPWINVCDGLGADSPYVVLYNMGALPATYVIADGDLVDGGQMTEKSLEKTIAEYLK